MSPTASATISPLAQARGDRAKAAEGDFPIFIGLFGTFSLLKAGRSISIRGGGKTEGLLAYLALEHGHWVAREALLDHLWPSTDVALAGQSLNSLVYTLRRQFSDAIGGASPVVLADSCYRLNLEAGVGVDVACFEHLATAGDIADRTGDRSVAIACYARAVGLYRGDVCLVGDLRALLERERLRALFLTLLARLADHHYAGEDYPASLEHCQRLLASDPCREDAHRLAMRCFVQLGARTQALRQFKLCERVLRTEFDAAPEPASLALFDQIRLAPETI